MRKLVGTALNIAKEEVVVKQKVDPNPDIEKVDVASRTDWGEF